MGNTQKQKSLFERELAEHGFKEAFEEASEAFQLEAQILAALEHKKWTYDDLAKATNTSKSNVSRDLTAGGLFNASFSRIGRIADALGMKLVALLIPKANVPFVLSKIEDIVRESANSTFGKSTLFPASISYASVGLYSRSANAVASPKQEFKVSNSVTPLAIGA